MAKGQIKAVNLDKDKVVLYLTVGGKETSLTRQDIVDLLELKNIAVKTYNSDSDALIKVGGIQGGSKSLLAIGKSITGQYITSALNRPNEPTVSAVKKVVANLKAFDGDIERNRPTTLIYHALEAISKEWDIVKVCGPNTALATQAIALIDDFLNKYKELSEIPNTLEDKIKKKLQDKSK